MTGPARFAGPDEDGELARLIAMAFADTAVRFGLDRDNCPSHPSFSTAETVARARGRGTRFLCAEEDGWMAGCVGLRPPDAEGTAELRMLAVRPQSRRRGLGQGLVLAAGELARAQGALRLAASIIAGHDELERWYVAHGFHPARTEHYDHLPFPVRVLERPLAAR